MTREQDLELLGAAADDKLPEIRAKYKRLANKLHPDHGGDTVKFAELSAAYKRIARSKCPACGGTKLVTVRQGAIVRRNQPCTKC